jgi:hypothetical protein
VPVAWMDEWIRNVTGQGEELTMSVHEQQTSNKTPSRHKTYVQVPCKILVLEEMRRYLMKITITK